MVEFEPISTFERGRISVDISLKGKGILEQ